MRFEVERLGLRDFRDLVMFLMFSMRVCALAMEVMVEAEMWSMISFESVAVSGLS